MQKKILTFIANNKKLLALYSESHPEHGKGGWFTVTGAVEYNETYEEAVAREMLEETGLDVEEIFPLNWGSIYNWKDNVCEEHNFISFIKPGKVALNEEHSEYKWLDLDDFIKLIKWDDDKEVLKKVLVKALKKEKYFEEFEIKDYQRCNVRETNRNP